ncbi:integral membrane protein, partial [Streptomyces coelicoflavus ZG0656]
MTEPTNADGDTRGPLGPAPAPAPARRRAVAAVLGDLRAVDGALYAAVAATSTPTLDRALRRLSHAADHSKVSLGI